MTAPTILPITFAHLHSLGIYGKIGKIKLRQEIGAMEQIKNKLGFICDMDGVIYHGNRVLSGVSTRETISTFAYRPTVILDGVGSIVQMAAQQKSK